MREGDAVFHFNGRQVIEGVCQAVFKIGENGHTFVNCFFPEGIVEAPCKPHHGQYFESAILGEDVFETRESLWDYYCKALGMPSGNTETQANNSQN